MSECIGAEYLELDYSGNKAIRYVKCLYQSTRAVSCKVERLYVQNPSIVLAFWAVTLGKLFAQKVIIDAHNSGVYPSDGKNKLLLSINAWILRRADLVIVSNPKLQNDMLKDLGVTKAISFPDPIPELPPYSETEADHGLKQNDNVFIICSWSEDEPIEAYINAAKKLPNIQFYFSGKFEKVGIVASEAPSNVHLLGFVSENEYLKHLALCSVIVDLTTRDNCLVCGAYEAIAYEKPVVLTDNEVNREVFGGGVVYCYADENSLIEAIPEALSSNVAQQKKVRELKDKMKKLQDRFCVVLDNKLKNYR
jgi:glycosyltransferase involved in cell wall biosynthesis